MRGASALCYKRGMRELREWISEKMRRRPRRGPNDSESTGKSGQELPANQPAPLRPTYPEAAPARAAETVTGVAEKHRAEPVADAAGTRDVSEPVAVKPEPPPEPRMVVETQPESLFGMTAVVCAPAALARRMAAAGKIVCTLIQSP